MKNYTPKKRLDLSKLQQLHTPSDLERIQIRFSKLMYHPETNQIIVLLESDDKVLGLPFSDFEGAMASFVFLGCALNSHIKTIHQMYLSLLEEVGSNLECGIVESKHGDMMYATLEFKNRKDRRIRTITSFADALLLTHLAGVPFYMLKKVVEELVDFNDWTYYHEMVDYADDDY